MSQYKTGPHPTSEHQRDLEARYQRVLIGDLTYTREGGAKRNKSFRELLIAMRQARQHETAKGQDASLQQLLLQQRSQAGAPVFVRLIEPVDHAVGQADHPAVDAELLAQSIHAFHQAAAECLNAPGHVL